MKELVLILVLLSSAAFSQDKPAPLDGPNRPFHDELLENLQGHWKITGIIMGQPRDMEITAAWVLNHQFLFIRQRDIKTIEGKQPYDALIYIGYDNASERLSSIGLIFSGQVF